MTFSTFTWSVFWLCERYFFEIFFWPLLTFLPFQDSITVFASPKMYPLIFQLCSIFKHLQKLYSGCFNRVTLLCLQRGERTWLFPACLNKNLQKVQWPLPCMFINLPVLGCLPVQLEYPFFIKPPFFYAESIFLNLGSTIGVKQFTPQLFPATFPWCS